MCLPRIFCRCRGAGANRLRRATVSLLVCAWRASETAEEETADTDDTEEEEDEKDELVSHHETLSRV